MLHFKSLNFKDNTRQSRRDIIFIDRRLYEIRPASEERHVADSSYSSLGTFRSSWLQS